MARFLVEQGIVARGPGDGCGGEAQGPEGDKAVVHEPGQGAVEGLLVQVPPDPAKRSNQTDPYVGNQLMVLMKKPEWQDDGGRLACPDPSRQLVLDCVRLGG